LAIVKYIFERWVHFGFGVDLSPNPSPTRRGAQCSPFPPRGDCLKVLPLPSLAAFRAQVCAVDGAKSQFFSTLQGRGQGLGLPPN
jgi:hypothetical protein